MTEQLNEVTQDQLNEFMEGQKIIIDGQRDIIESINKLLALFILEPVNDATNPILNLGDAAKLLGISSSQLSEGCKNNEVPHRRIGSKYLFSRVALMAWLHNINMSYLFEKMEQYKKYYKDRYGEEDPTTFLKNWVRFTIKPVTGVNEDFQIKFEEPSTENKLLDAHEAAEIIGVPVHKVREWANAFLYYKIPVMRHGNRFVFVQEEIMEWMKTKDFIKLKEDYIKNKTLSDERNKAAEARREAERIAKEERKKNRKRKKYGAIFD